MYQALKCHKKYSIMSYKKRDEKIPQVPTMKYMCTIHYNIDYMYLLLLLLLLLLLTHLELHPHQCQQGVLPRWLRPLRYCSSPEWESSGPTSESEQDYRHPEN